MVIKESLSDLSHYRTSLLFVVGKKLSQHKTSMLNADMDSQLKVDYSSLESLLSSFEARLRECEIIHYSYLRNVDHTLLSGITVSLPLKIQTELTYGTGVLTNDTQINDERFYRDVVDAQFRYFILSLSSLYEVMVKLLETLVKKVVVHTPEKKPLSTPLDVYITTLKNLVNLRYRK